MVTCRCALVAVATGLGVVACDSVRPLPPAVLVDPARLTLEDGQIAKITAKLRNPKGARTVRWTSSNPAVATVDFIGNVTAVTNGTTSIVVAMTEDSTISATVPVTVSRPGGGERQRDVRRRRPCSSGGSRVRSPRSCAQPTGAR